MEHDLQTLLSIIIEDLEASEEEDTVEELFGLYPRLDEIHEKKQKHEGLFNTLLDCARPLFEMGIAKDYINYSEFREILLRYLRFLRKLCSDDELPDPAEAGELEDALHLLKNFSFPETEHIPAAPSGEVSSATEDVPEDEEFDEEFIQEALEVIGERINNVIRICDECLSRKAEKDDYTVIYREFHTMKSECGVMGFPQLATFSERVEKTLKPFKDEESPPFSASLSETLKEICAFAHLLLEAAPRGGLPKSKEREHSLVEKLLETLSHPVEVVPPPEEPEGDGEDAGFFPLDEEEEKKGDTPSGESAGDTQEAAFFPLDEEEEKKLSDSSFTDHTEKAGFFPLDDDEEEALEASPSPSLQKEVSAEELIAQCRSLSFNAMPSFFEAFTLFLKNIEKEMEKQNPSKEFLELYSLAPSFIRKGRENTISDFEAYKTHLASFIESLSDSLAALQAGESIRIKGRVSQLKLFLGLFDFASEEEETEKSDDVDLSEELEILLKRIENVEEIVLAMQEGVLNPEDINVIFREFHTLKSESALLELSFFSELSHKIESALSSLREIPVDLTAALIDSFLGTVDACKKLLEKATHATQSDYDRSEKAVTQMEEAIRHCIEGSGSSPDTSGKEEHTDTAMEEPVAEQNFQEELQGLDTTRRKSSGIEVKLDKLDKIIDLAGEINTIFHLINQSEDIKAMQSPSLLNDIHLLGRMCKELQLSSLNMRTITIASLFQKLKRVVRNIAREEKKKVNVVVRGDDLEVDKNIIDGVSEALIHMMRNSVDHGIESPRERISAGKKESATISLSLQNREDQIIFEVTDDGRGIDLERVRAKVLEKELATAEELEHMTPKEIYSFLFKPGFSTATKVTSVSGRGVGMDVVFKRVEELGGVVEVESETGEWTKVSLSVPSSFTQLEAVVVRVGTGYYIIPLSMVKEMLDHSNTDINTVNRKGNVVNVRGELVPLISLTELMDCSYDEHSATKAVVVVQHKGRRCAILCDEVVTTQEVVLKKLEGPIAKLEYINGSGILGNRKIGLILNIARILQSVALEYRSEGTGKGKDGNADNRIETVEIGTNKVAMIDFYLEWQDSHGKKNKELFAINAFKTLEFIPIRDLTPIPTAPPAFEGMIQVREFTLPVLNLGRMIGLGSDNVNNALIVICEFNRKRVGITVSGVNRVNYISWEEILPPPQGKKLVRSEYIVGTILENDAVTFVLDFEKLLAEVLHFYDDLHLLHDDSGHHKGHTLSEAQKEHDGINLLLVEDSTLVRKRFAKSLHAVGYNIIEAENGQEALELITHYFEDAKLTNKSILDYIDVVITDIEMPLMDGYTLTKSIKEHPELRVLPVVLHSSISNDTMIKRSQEVQADGFINKCDTKSLRDFLDKVI